RRKETPMKRLVFVLAVVACVGLGARVASATNPFADRHFVHYQLQNYYNLQDYNRYTFGTDGIPWAGSYPRQTPRRDVIAPAGDFPRDCPPTNYRYQRPDSQYSRPLIPPTPSVPGSPPLYPPPPPLKPRAWDSNPAEMISPFDSKTGQPGHDDYAP